MSKICGGRTFNTKVPPAYVFWRTIKWKQEIITIQVSLGRHFALSLILGLRNVLFCTPSVPLLRSEASREYPLPSRFHRKRYQHFPRKLLKTHQKTKIQLSASLNMQNIYKLKKGLDIRTDKNSQY